MDLQELAIFVMDLHHQMQLLPRYLCGHGLLTKPFERVWRGAPKINTLVVLSGPALKMAAGPELSTGLNLYISHGGGAVGDFREAMMTEHFGRFWIALRDYV